MFGRFTLALLVAVSAFGQTQTPEVRGVIHEAGSATGVPGVEVGLYEFGPNEQNFITRKLVVSTFTDAAGVFSLKPGHMGEFMLTGKKASYLSLDGYGATLTTKAPVHEVRLSMIRPGSLTGRAIDSEGNPLAHFTVTLEAAKLGFSDRATTDTEGYFAANNLRPGEYLVHIRPKHQDREELLEYSDAAFKIVDQDAESSYWPGGLPDRDTVLPVPVAGGAIANVGTITVRKKPYYRVHVSLEGECEANERWTYRIITHPEDFPPPQEQFGGCRKDFLLTGLKPGTYTLAVWVGHEVKAWGLAPFTITNANVETTLRLNPSFSVSGQVKTTEGHTLAELGPVEITMQPDDHLGAVDWATQSDYAGAFLFQTVAWPQQLLSVRVQQSGTYVKEIRYDGLPVRSPRVDMIPGAHFEVLLDSGAAAITGTAKGDDNWVLLIRDGIDVPLSQPFNPFQFMFPASQNGGSFAMRVPPGTYRVLMLPRTFLDGSLSAEELALRLARAEKVTVGSGEHTSIDVKK